MPAGPHAAPLGVAAAPGQGAATHLQQQSAAVEDKRWGAAAAELDAGAGTFDWQEMQAGAPVGAVGSEGGEAPRWGQQAAQGMSWLTEGGFAAAAETLSAEDTPPPEAGLAPAAAAADAADDDKPAALTTAAADAAALAARLPDLSFLLSATVTPPVN